MDISITSYRYEWRGFGDGVHPWLSFCFLSIFHPHPEMTVVIATDPGGDSGSSITNCAGALITNVIRDFEIDSSTLLWFEQYPYYRAMQPEAEFAQVLFEWDNNKAVNIRWKPIMRTELEAITQHPL